MENVISTRIFDLKLATAVSIVVGTSIGAGMLGLPVETARAGFIPSVCLFILTWFITIATGILFSEVILSRPPGGNYISLSKTILGNKFTCAIFGLYILLFYSLIAAYTKGIGVLLSEDLTIVASSWAGSLLFILLFMPMMYFGTGLIGKFNAILAIVLLLSFSLLISIGNKNVSPMLLSNQNWSHTLFSLPLIISSFGFHGTVPSLIDYLDRDRRKIRLAIIIGSTITLIIYFLWELMILGSIPLHGEISLVSAWENDQTAITPLSLLAKNSIIWSLAHIFSLAAIITSFFGVSIGLIDFLVDAFQWKKNFYTQTALLVSIYISALFLSMTELRIFYLSLNYGAGIAGTFLLIFTPAYMMYRSERKLDSPIFGCPPKAVLPIVFVFSAISVLSCIFSYFGQGVPGR